MLAEKFFLIAQYGHEATLYILFILSFLSVTCIIERFWALSPAQKNSEKMSRQIADAIQSNSLKDLEDFAKDKETMEGRTLSYGIRHIKEHGPKGLEELLDSVARIERPFLEKRLNFLATVGSNAPFIGLLGTVFGIMEAFHGLATSQGEMEKVMEGISQALVATAFGLFVAIPAVISYNYFQKRVRSVMQGFDGLKSICVAYAKTLKGAI